MMLMWRFLSSSWCGLELDCDFDFNSQAVCARRVHVSWGT